VAFISREYIESRYGHASLAFKRVFGADAVAPAPDFEEGKRQAPYVLMLGDREPEAAVELIKRMQEYAYSRPLHPHEAEEWNRQLRDVSARIQERPWERDQLSLRLPYMLFHDETCKERAREFASLHEAVQMLEKEGARFDVWPDEAAVALSQATGTHWQLKLREDNTPQGLFRQIRVVTADPLTKPVAAKEALAEKLGAKDGMVFETPNKHILGIIYLTPQSTRYSVNS
jgi:hypothetical protein